MGDQGEIKRACESMNVGPAYTLLAAMLTMRPWDDIVDKDRSKIKSKNTAGEQEMLKAYAEKYVNR
jgi:aarF domain-containing kinase